MIEISAEHKHMADAFRQLLEHVERRNAASDNSGRAVDFAKVERQLAEACQQLECAAMRPLLEALDIDAENVIIGDQPWRRVERCEGTYHCRSGDVRAMRSLYRKVGQRNAKVVDPISLRAGVVVGDGWLPQTAATMAFLLQLGTSREAEATAIETATLPFSRSSFERVGHLVGEQFVGVREVVEQVLIEEYEPPAEAHSVSASLDRVSVPMEEPAEPGSEQKVTRNFRMAFCGTVTLHDETGEALETIRYGRMPNGSAEELCDALFNDVLELLANKPSLKVLLLADGAHEMWNLLKEVTEDRLRGVELIELIDFYHLSEKLAAAAKKLYPSYERLREQKVGQWKLLLLNDGDGAEKILAELKASGLEEEGNGECPVHAAITYLCNHRGRFDYASARAEGLPIGSGAVEPSCKTLFEVRLKRSSSRWKEKTGAHIIHLRALALSDRWQRGIQLALAPLRSNVEAAA